MGPSKSWDWGKTPRKDINRGSVVNIDQTGGIHPAAVEEAGFISGAPVRSAFVGVSGGHVQSFNTHGIVAIKNKIVAQEDIDRVIELAGAVTMPADHQMHPCAAARIYCRRAGRRHRACGNGRRAPGVQGSCCHGGDSRDSEHHPQRRSAGLHIDRLVLQPFASSLAALSDDERDLGVAIVDIGAAPRTSPSSARVRCAIRPSSPWVATTSRGTSR